MTKKTFLEQVVIGIKIYTLKKQLRAKSLGNEENSIKKENHIESLKYLSSNFLIKQTKKEYVYKLF